MAMRPGRATMSPIIKIFILRVGSLLFALNKYERALLQDLEQGALNKITGLREFRNGRHDAVIEPAQTGG